MFQGHSDDINADNEGDDEVQVVTGTQSMDSQTGTTIGSIVWQLLGLCKEKTMKKTTEHNKKNKASKYSGSVKRQVKKLI